MKILDSLKYPFQDAYQNPRKAALTSVQSTISLMVGYVAYKEGSSLLGSFKSIPCSCHVPMFNESVEFGSKLLAVAALCLASVVILRYNFSKPLPKIPAGHSER